ncbi:MAG: hypothetical protein Q7S87_09050 [Agitococcus sp.]|nr:hypothetical protein [Agitococcus sp.]MDO9177048.1 hypothetical protein [Agitococcus sp.]
MRKFVVSLFFTVPLFATASTDIFRLKPEPVPLLGAHTIETDLIPYSPKSEASPQVAPISTTGLPPIPTAALSGITAGTASAIAGATPAPVAAGAPAPVYTTLAQAKKAGIDPLGDVPPVLASSAPVSVQPAPSAGWPSLAQFVKDANVWLGQLATILKLPPIALPAISMPSIGELHLSSKDLLTLFGTLLLGGLLALSAFALKRRFSPKK